MPGTWALVGICEFPCSGRYPMELENNDEIIGTAALPLSYPAPKNSQTTKALRRPGQGSNLRHAVQLSVRIIVHRHQPTALLLRVCEAKQ